MKWKTPFNAKPSIGEINKLPHETLPDQSMSVKEIMDRHARGLPVTGQRVPVYNGEEEFPDVLRMDISERMELLEAIRAGIKAKQADLQKQQLEAKTKAEKEAEAERKRKEFLDKQIQNPDKPKEGQ